VSEFSTAATVHDNCFCRVAIKQKKAEPDCANQSYNIGGNLKYYPSILHEMVKACFICGAKDVRLFEIRSNMKQRQKWFEAFETFCGKQIYEDNDKHNFLICICNIKYYKNYGLLRNL
jgi:hypothetical protein